MPIVSLNNALDAALMIPRKIRESPLNVGLLRTLCVVSVEGIDRTEVLQQGTHGKATVDKRLSILVQKGLITYSKSDSQRYHDAGSYKPTEFGCQIYEIFKRNKTHRALIRALDHACNLPVNKREEPINVGHLKVLYTIYNEPKIEMNSLVIHCNDTKATIRSRCLFLERKMLVDKYPKVNTGGNGNPNHYVISSKGVAMVKMLI